MSTSFAVLGPKKRPFCLSDYYIIMRYLDISPEYLIIEKVNEPTTVNSSYNMMFGTFLTLLPG